MTMPAIITCAITGAQPRKAQNPAVPVTQAEQIKSTHEAYEAGAALVHIHVRNKDESPSSDPELFALVQEGVKKHCPGMIIQFSTGGRGRKPEERGSALSLRPDMASLATGSVNFPNRIYENAPDLVEGLARSMLQFDVKPEIEVFDLAMLYNARDLAERGLIKRRCTCSSSWASSTRCRRGARCWNSWCRKLRKLCPARPGPPPASAVISSRSTCGRSSSAATCARGWRTTSNSTAIAWPRAMPSWSGACATYAPTYGRPPRRHRKRAPPGAHSCLI